MKFRAIVVLLAVLAAGCQSLEERRQREAAIARFKAGQALFEEKCKTAAGEKIYRTMKDVEGILLLKVRPGRRDRELADPAWPGAAFARESRGDEFLTSFLGYEHSSSQIGEPVTPKSRGYITPEYRPDNPSNLPGYRWVEVIDEKDGKRYRVTGTNKVVGRKDTNAPNVRQLMRADPNYELNVYAWRLDRSLATEPPPRYGVTYEDHVIPEERALWVASSTVRVLDLTTNEVLGEMVRYAWAGGGPTPASPTPWLRAYRCPDHSVGTGAATRKFVDQILIPSKEK